MKTVKTRKEAAEAAESKYYTGKPCSRGHDSERYTSTGICCKCSIENTRAYNKKMRFVGNNIKAGSFVYELNLDDHAAALAFCQSLDLQRGRVPKDALRPAQASADVQLPYTLPADIQARRDQLVRTSPVNTAPHYLPKP